MDLATSAGIFIGIVCIVLGTLGGGTSSEAIGVFTHLPSALVVLGGSFAALLLSVPMRSVLNMGRVAFKVFSYKRPAAGRLVQRLVGFAELARREGILALENDVEKIQDPFLARALGLAVDGTDPEEISEILNSELDAMSERHAKGRRSFEILAKFAPAWGLIGTLIGLIIMLATLDDESSSIGMGMSMALITTLYGAVLANFIFGPMAEKLQARSEEEIAYKRIAIEGILAIQIGDNPRIVRQKLKSHLAPGIVLAA